MDDPDLAWPAWKFGLKKDDIFTSLHDKYNTFTFSLQDTQAFHADVREISNHADSAEEFHRLLADRREQRLRELHDSLESLAVEIIANPRLMDSPHWNDAVQLFRTRSFDSLVRYFANFLPSEYMTRYDEAVSSSSSMSEATSDDTASVDSFDDDEHTPYGFLNCSAVIEEPRSIDDQMTRSASYSSNNCDNCLSFRPTPTIIDDRPPSQAKSFADSESDPLHFALRRSTYDDDDNTSTSGSIDTGASSCLDYAESCSSLESLDDKEKEQDLPTHYIDEEDDILTAQLPEDSFDCLEMNTDPYDIYPTTESDTPTPRPEGAQRDTSYIDFKSVLCRRLPHSNRRSTSPKEQRAQIMLSSEARRRSPEEAYSKIQKPTSDLCRKRTKGRTT